MSKIQSIRKNIPIKGMNTVMPKRNFADEFSPSIINCWYDDGVTLRRRLCISASASSTIPSGAKAIFEYKDVVKELFVLNSTGLFLKFIPMAAPLIPNTFGGTFSPSVVLSGVTTTYTVIPIDAAYAGVVPPLPITTTALNTPLLGSTTVTTTIPATKLKSGRVAVSIAASSITLSFAGKVRVSKLGKMMIVSDGLGMAVKYDGAVFSPILKPPRSATGNVIIGNIFHVHLGRMYAAGDPALPMTINISDTVTSSGIDYWDSPPASDVGEQGGFLDVSADLGVGDTITGLTTHRGLLVVMCKNHLLFYVVTEKLSGVAFSLYKMVGGEGCVTQDSIQSVGDDVLFLSPNGFKKLSVSLVQGDSQVNDLSQPVNNVIKAKLRDPLILLDNMSSTYNAKYGLYMMSFGDGEVWVMQPAFDGWFKWLGLPGRLFTDSDLITYYATSQLFELSNKVFQDGTLAAPLPVLMSWELPPFRFGQDTKIRWNRIEVIYESSSTLGSVFIEHFPDLNESAGKSFSTLAPIALINAGADVAEGSARLPIAMRSEIVSIRISNMDVSDFRFKVVEMYYNAGGIRE